MDSTREHHTCLILEPGKTPVTVYRCGITSVFFRWANGLPLEEHNANPADTYCAHQDELRIAEMEHRDGGPCPLVCARPEAEGAQ